MVPALFFLTSITARLSAFLNTVLAVVRTLNITLPFYHIRSRRIMISIVCYMLGWVPIIVYEVYYYFVEDLKRWPQQIYDKLVTLPTAGNALVVIGTSANFTGSKDVVLWLGVGIPFLLPSIIAVLCLCLQSYTLLKNNVAEDQRITDHNRAVTVTILQLTVLFCICNSAFIIFAKFMDLFTQNLTRESTSKMEYVTSTMFPMLNSAINPMILLYRGCKVWQSMVYKVKKALCLLSKDEIVQCNPSRKNSQHSSVGLPGAVKAPRVVLLSHQYSKPILPTFQD